MNKMTVVRDADGVVINIGEWNYMPEPRPVLAQGGEVIGKTRRVDEASGLILVGEDGLPEIVEVRAKEGEILGFDIANPIIHNPLPEGATVSEAEISQRPDGGLYVVERAADPAGWAHGDGHAAVRLNDAPQGLSPASGPGHDISEAGGA